MKGSLRQSAKYFAIPLLMFSITYGSQVWGQKSATLSVPEQPAVFQKAIFIDVLGSEMANHIAAERALKKICQAGFNAVFLQVRHWGEVYYASVLEPRSTRIDPGYPDPLSDIILMCHSSRLANVLDTYAWVSVFPAHSARISQAPPAGNVMQRHPEWLTRNFAGHHLDHNKTYNLDPGIPAVQDYVTALIVELVKNYSVDGILLDRFRYPDDGWNWGYSPLALETYFRDTGAGEKPKPYDPQWCRWRREQLTKLLGRIYTNVKRLKPDVQVYVGAISWGKPPLSPDEFTGTPAYSLVFQDWLTWAKKGLIDGLLLYNYKQFPPQVGEFNDWLDFAIANKQKTKCVCAIGGFFNFSDAVINQIKIARQKGAYGTALYCYRIPTQDNADFLFKSLPHTAFSEQLAGFRPSGIKYKPLATLTPLPTPITTPTLHLTPTPTPSPLPVVIPALPGLPALPNLKELITPTPVITETPPVPSKVVEKKAVRQKRPAAVKKEARPGTPPLAVKVAEPPEIAIPRTPAPPKWDTIYLKKGGSFKGRVLDEVGGKVTIETSKGFVMTVPLDEVEKIVKFR